ncbi:unnamed protein product [Linum trigynum]|uniref:Uncharacterized protein n=1 Tax=Linum trigynum TaxID=586398 RepID=A0AAV2EBT2_9ROSI
MSDEEEDIPEENPGANPVVGAEEDPMEEANENLNDLDDDTLDQFATALAYVEEGLYVAAAAVAPGGLGGGLVDYSTDDESI